jgi:hypothetical protein
MFWYRLNFVKFNLSSKIYQNEAKNIILEKDIILLNVDRTVLEKK